MNIILYQAPMSSASPAAWALAELGIEHQSVMMDIRHGKEHKKPEFLALNPMGQVPTLVDDGHSMFESSAIIVYLGDRYGVQRGLWPAIGSAQHMVALTWTAWTAVTLGSTLRMIFFSGEKAPTLEMQNPALHRFSTQRLAELMKVLDGQLTGREYLTGEIFTLSDVYASAAVSWGTGVAGFDLKTVPHVASWIERCLSRPWAKVMQGPSSKG
jgi:glutathione S-transferase